MTVTRCGGFATMCSCMRAQNIRVAECERRFHVLGHTNPLARSPKVHTDLLKQLSDFGVSPFNSVVKGCLVFLCRGGNIGGGCESDFVMWW